MKITKDVSLIDKEILDLNFINKFTRSQIEAEIKRQEKIFPILIKPQENAVKLSEEEEELKHQLELNPNLFIVPNITYESKNLKNFNETRTSSPAVIVQAPAFIDTTRNGQQVKNLDYIRNFQAEPYIYQENVRKGREESTDNISVSLQHLNLLNVKIYILNHLPFSLRVFGLLASFRPRIRGSALKLNFQGQNLGSNFLHPNFDLKSIAKTGFLKLALLKISIIK